MKPFFEAASVDRHSPSIFNSVPWKILCTTPTHSNPAKLIQSAAFLPVRFRDNVAIGTTKNTARSGPRQPLFLLKGFSIKGALFGEDAFGIRLTVHLRKRQVVELHQLRTCAQFYMLSARQIVAMPWVDGRLNGQSGIGTEAWAAN
jgi:hypothetical protein